MTHTLATLAVLIASAATSEGMLAESLAHSTSAFLDALSPDQRAKACFDFDDAERFVWLFVPRDREGLTLRDMNPEQEKLALEVLRTALSAAGYEMVSTIRKLEDVLRMLENDDGNRRNPRKYYFSVFGTPGGDAAWGLRYEGHHTSLHWTVIGKEVIASTPQFLGSNPAEVLDGPMKGTRVLGTIEDLGRGLVKSLADEQRAKAVCSETAPRDIMSGTERAAILQDRQGVTYQELTKEQRGVLLSLIRQLANVQQPEVAKARMQRVRAGEMATVAFAWMGGLDPGQGHYFSVQGDTFLIEYDNTQNNANHVHLVWRDLGNDFGDDALKRHYEQHADASHAGIHNH